MQMAESVSVVQRFILTAALVLAVFAGPALAQKQGAPPVKVTKGVLTNAAGMTLYTWDNDPVGKSVCNGGCAMSWPPLLAKEAAVPTGDYSIVIRDDGKKQWAYKGKPLYLWSNDKKPGDQRADLRFHHVVTISP